MTEPKKKRRKPVHTTLVSGDLLSVAGQKAIRDAFKKGERKVIYKNREFTLERKGSEHILVKPVLGRLPMAMIQIESGPTKKLQKYIETPVDTKLPPHHRRSGKK